MMSSLKTNRPWWAVMLFATCGCGGCGCAGRDHPVFSAAANGEVEKVREALDADPKLLTETYRRPPKGRDPFSSNTGKQLVHIAAENGKVEILKLLKDRGADLAPDNPELSAMQPIHWAAWGNHPETLAWLLEQGVSVDAKVKRSDATPLHSAVEARRVEAAAMLLERGAAVDARNNGMTPLLRLCQSFSDDKNASPLAKLLLDRGADVNARDASHMTPLHHAVKRFTPDTSLLDLLIANKADLRAKSLDGHTPIEEVPLDRANIAELLIANGASRELWDKRKRDAEKPVEPLPLAPEKK